MTVIILIFLSEIPAVLAGTSVTCTFNARRDANYLIVENKTVNYNDEFTLHINLEPAEEVYSWEFSLIFDNTKLEANSVTEGDIFSGKTTMFSDGNISNEGGNMTSMYCLIHPTAQGGVTESGSCVNISFTAIGSGEAYVNFWYNESVIEPGVCNKTQYLPLEVFNGTVTINVISYTNITPANESWVEIDNHTMKMNVSNNLGETMNVSFYWSNNTLIGEDINVENNTFANVTVGFNYTRYQQYNWYVIVNSTSFDDQSDTWWFKGEAYDWDVNRDQEIDINDITGTTGHYGEEGEAHWIRADCTRDGEVDINDITMITGYYGEEY